MKKVLKDKNAIPEQKIRITVSEELTKLSKQLPPSKKLAEANELLSKAKRPFPWEK